MIAKGGDRKKLVAEMKIDPTLEHVRGMAERREKGYLWKSDLLMLELCNDALETAKIIVLPMSYWTKVLSLDHDRLGHLGINKSKAIIRRNFYWPNIYSDVVQYCKFCKVFQVADKTAVRRFHMVERQIMTEPHETLAFDFVGPLPQAKGGFRFIMTCIDQVTKVCH